MKKDSANKKVYSIKQLNKIMGLVLFGTVFLFTFLFVDKNIKQHWLALILGLMAGAIVIEVIIWITLYFVFKKKNETENDKNIKKAIEQIKKETIQEQNNQETKDKPLDIKG